MRFGPDSDERSCDREVPHPGINGSFACLRRAGHDGDCIALARDAALADGVCFYCPQADRYAARAELPPSMRGSAR